MKTINKYILYDSQNLVNIYVILHFGSTGKSTPRSMNKKLIFCEFVMVTIRFELNLFPQHYQF